VRVPPKSPSTYGSGLRVDALYGRTEYIEYAATQNTKIKPALQTHTISNVSSHVIPSENTFDDKPAVWLTADLNDVAADRA